MARFKGKSPADEPPPLRLGRRGLLARDGLLRERSGRRDQREREADENDPGAHGVDGLSLLLSLPLSTVRVLVPPLWCVRPLSRA